MLVSYGHCRVTRPMGAGQLRNQDSAGGDEERGLREPPPQAHLGVDDAVEGLVERQLDLHPVRLTLDVQSEDLRRVLRPNQVGWTEPVFAQICGKKAEFGIWMTEIECITPK